MLAADIAVHETAVASGGFDVTAIVIAVVVNVHAEPLAVVNVQVEALAVVTVSIGVSDGMNAAVGASADVNVAVGISADVNVAVGISVVMNVAAVTLAVAIMIGWPVVRALNSVEMFVHVQVGPVMARGGGVAVEAHERPFSALTRRSSE